MTAAVAELPASALAEDDLEGFEVYRNGAQFALLHIECNQVRHLTRMPLRALVDEALAHADTCEGRDR